MTPPPWIFPPHGPFSPGESERRNFLLTSDRRARNLPRIVDGAAGGGPVCIRIFRQILVNYITRPKRTSITGAKKSEAILQLGHIQRGPIRCGESLLLSRRVAISTALKGQASNAPDPCRQHLQQQCSITPGRQLKDQGGLLPFRPKISKVHGPRPAPDRPPRRGGRVLQQRSPPEMKDR